MSLFELATEPDSESEFVQIDFISSSDAKKSPSEEHWLEIELVFGLSFFGVMVGGGDAVGRLLSIFGGGLTLWSAPGRGPGFPFLAIRAGGLVGLVVVDRWRDDVGKLRGTQFGDRASLPVVGLAAAARALLTIRPGAG